MRMARPVFLLLPFRVTEALGRGAAWFGFLLAAISAGSLLGLLATGTMRPQEPEIVTGGDTPRR